MRARPASVRIKSALIRLACRASSRFGNPRYWLEQQELVSMTDLRLNLRRVRPELLQPVVRGRCAVGRAIVSRTCSRCLRECTTRVSLNLRIAADDDGCETTNGRIAAQVGEEGREAVHETTVQLAGEVAGVRG